MSSTEGDGGFTRPGWFSRAAALFGGGAATVAGVSLWDDPVSFVIAAVASWIVDGVLDLFAAIGELIVLVASQILGAFTDVAIVAFDAIGVVAQAILFPIRAVNAMIVTLASSLGPLSFLGVVLAWAIIGGLAALTIRGIVEVVRFI